MSFTGSKFTTVWHNLCRHMLLRGGNTLIHESLSVADYAWEGASLNRFSAVSLVQSRFGSLVEKENHFFSKNS